MPEDTTTAKIPELEAQRANILYVLGDTELPEHARVWFKALLRDVEAKLNELIHEKTANVQRRRKA